MRAPASRQTALATALDLALCLCIAFLARRVAALDERIPVASLTLFGAMAGAAGLRRLLGRPVRRLHYEVPLSMGLILLGVQFLPEELSVLGWSAPIWILGYQFTFALVFWLLVRRGIFAKRAGGLLAMGLSGAGLSSVLATLESDPEAPAPSL